MNWPTFQPNTGVQLVPGGELPGFQEQLEDRVCVPCREHQQSALVRLLHGVRVVRQVVQEFSRR